MYAAQSSTSCDEERGGHICFLNFWRQAQLGIHLNVTLEFTEECRYNIDESYKG